MSRPMTTQVTQPASPPLVSGGLVGATPAAVKAAVSSAFETQRQSQQITKLQITHIHAYSLTAKVTMV